MAVAIKKTAAIAIAAGLTFAGSAGVALETATPAVAQLPAAPDARIIDSNQTGEILIHKKVNPTNYGEATGQPATVSGTGLDGVGFTVYRITAIGGDNVTTPTVQSQYNKLAEFSRAANLTFSSDTQVTGSLNGQTVTATVEKAGTKTTAGGGDASFTGLALGGYVVRETSLPTKADTAYVPAKPFVAIVPTTNTGTNGSEWDYSIDVYPKNGETTVTKSVKDLTLDADKKPTEATNVTGDISYTVTGTVPAAPSGEYLKSFVVEDNYDSKELTVKPATVKVQVVGADGKTTRDLTANTDYTFATQNVLSQAPDHKGTVAQGANAGWTVTIKDPFKLVPGETVTVTIDATVASAADNLVENSARTYGTTGRANSGFQPGPSNTTTPTPPTTPGTPPDEPETPWDTPDTKVQSYFGDIKIEKFADDLNDDPATEENERGLEGAKFDIFRCKAGANDSLELVGKAVQNVTTDKNGYATFSGLHVTNFANNVALVQDEQFDYCLKETKAPEGYALNPNIIKVNERLQTSTAQDGKTIEVKAVSQAISNTKKTTPTLPATGGMGILIVVLAGLAIIGGGAYAARRNAA